MENNQTITINTMVGHTMAQAVVDMLPTSDECRQNMYVNVNRVMCLQNTKKTGRKKMGTCIHSIIYSINCSINCSIICSINCSINCSISYHLQVPHSHRRKVQPWKRDPLGRTDWQGRNDPSCSESSTGHSFHVLVANLSQLAE